MSGSPLISFINEYFFYQQKKKCIKHSTLIFCNFLADQTQFYYLKGNLFFLWILLLKNLSYLFNCTYLLWLCLFLFEGKEELCLARASGFETQCYCQNFEGYITLSFYQIGRCWCYVVIEFAQIMASWIIVSR